MNSVILIGNLASDVETREVGDGRRVATFRWRCSGGLSTSRANGRRIFFPSWYGGKRRTPARGICARGRKAAVEGRLQARSYQAQDGGKRYVTEVVAEQVEFFVACAKGEWGKRRGGGAGGWICGLRRGVAVLTILVMSTKWGRYGATVMRNVQTSPGRGGVPDKFGE